MREMSSRLLHNPVKSVKIHPSIHSRRPRMARSLCLSILLLTAVPMIAAGQPFKYPSTKKGDLVEELHGVKVPDPFRWLEGDVREKKEVADWVAEQNKVTFGYLAGIPERDAIKKRLTDLWNYEKFTAPRKVADSFYVFGKNDGLQNHFVYYTQETLKSEPKVLLDPNAWSKDGTVALADFEFSEDGKHVADGTSEAGSDWNTWKVMELPSRKVMTDELKWIKFSNVSW